MCDDDDDKWCGVIIKLAINVIFGHTRDLPLNYNKINLKGKAFLVDY